MPAIVTNKIRLSTAKQFVESFDETSPTSYYLFIGKSTTWNDDLSPTVPVDSPDVQYYIHEDIIFMKKLQANNITHAIRRYNWTTGVYYREYSHDIDLFATVNRTSAGALSPSDVTPFYVVTTTNDEYRIYKCVNNNIGAASTIDPSTIDTGTGEGDTTGNNGLIYCSDGYIWKFMYSISDADMLKFVTSDWIPVKTVKYNDSSRQWAVQSAARDGAIEVIDVISAGSGYSVAPTITIPSPHKGGTQAVSQTITISGGSVVTPIKLSTVGTGYYKQPTITVSSGNLNVRAILSPKGGHGFDAVSELGGVAVMIYVELSGSESSQLITLNDYRRIGIIVDPVELNSVKTSQGVATSSPGTINYLSPYTSSTNPFTQFNNIKVASIVTPDGTFLGKEIVILSGPGKGERRKIIGYHESSDVLLVDRDWPTISDPTTRSIIGSTSIYGILTNSTSENNLYKFELTTNSTPGSFTIDSTITASGGKSAKIVQYTPASSPDPAYVLVNEVVGQFAASNSISDGTNSATIATATKLGSQEYYGDVIYLENRRPINRASDQTEEIRIVLEF
jgi:hypothetical protein